MNKRNKSISLFLLVVFMISIIPKVTFGANIEYRSLTPKKNVELNKVWNIKFNRELSTYSSRSHVKIVDDKNHNIPIRVSFNKDKTGLVVEPVNDYLQGRTYTLIVEDKVKSDKGNTLKKSVKMDFTTKNLYAGLPYEHGLLIVGDTAYSLEYLEKNASKKNEILSDDYYVYYCYEDDEQRVKNVLGQSNINGQHKPSWYNTNNPITYIDGDGSKSTYIWNDEKSQFDPVVPSIDVQVSVNNSPINSMFKVIGVKLNSVYGVKGAKYFMVSHSNEMKEIGSTIIYTSRDIREKVYILSEDKSVIAESTIVTTYSGTRKNFLTLRGDSSDGNTAGNINNNGYVATDADGAIYYNNTGDSNKLYKLDPAGLIDKMICEDNAQYINVVQDWIYYSNYSDGGKLYKVKTDGSMRQKVLDDMASYITISGDLIYYSNHTDNGRIYTVRRDGSDIVIDRMGEMHGNPLSSSSIDETAYISVSGQWIYYVNVNDRHKPYVIDKSGKYRAKLSDEWADSIQIHGSWVYYTTGTGILSKVDKDGNGKTVPMQGETQEIDKGFHLNVVGDWIYYSNAKDEGKLYKVKTDGSGEKLKLSDDKVTYINIVNDTIYYVSNGKLYKLPLDTDGTIKGVAVSKVNNSNKINYVNDIDVTVPYEEVNNTLTWIENKYLPGKVPVILDDNTMHQMVVNWDRDNVSIQNGIRIYTGDLIGFSKKIKLNLTIPSEMLNETTTISVYNNPGRSSDVIQVYNKYDNNKNLNPPQLNLGDVIKVYDIKEGGKMLGQATVTRDGIYNKATIGRLELDDYGQQSYWISVTREGKVESKRTEIKLVDQPTISSVDDMDEKNIGITVADFEINQFLRPQTLHTKEYNIYIIPSRGKLDLSTGEYESRGDASVSDSNNSQQLGWNGKEDSQRNKEIDSAGQFFKKGSYDLIVSAYFETTGGEDNRGYSPIVNGWVCSKPATVSSIAEAVPDKPTLKRQPVKGGETITLDKAPMLGERAYLIPYVPEEPKSDDRYYAQKVLMHNIYMKIRDWRAQIDGDLVFTEEEEKLLTMIHGDGQRKTMPAPVGFDFNTTDEDRSPTYCPNVEYRLFVVNSVGSSKPSDTAVVVDNRPPVLNDEFLSEYSKYASGDDDMMLQSGYEDADIYFVNKIHSLWDKVDLERAYKDKLIDKISINRGITKFYDTSNLKGDERDKEFNYYIIALDEVGNTATLKVNVYVDYSKLKDLIDATNDMLNKSIGLITDTGLAEIQDAKARALETIGIAKSPLLTNIVTQGDIRGAYKNLENALIRNGAPVAFKNDIDIYEKEEFGTTTALQKSFDSLQNMLLNLRYDDNRTQLIDKDNVVSNIWLPDQGGYGDGITIAWQSDSTTTIDPDSGEVKRPIGTNPVDKYVKLTATMSKDGQERSVTQTVRVKAKTFTLKINNPADNTFTIVTDGLNVTNASNVDVTFYDGNDYVSTYTTDGVTISMRDDPVQSGGYWKATLHAEGTDDHNQENAHSILIQVKITDDFGDIIYINNQIRLEIPNNANDFVVRLQ